MNALPALLALCASGLLGACTSVPEPALLDPAQGVEQFIAPSGSAALRVDWWEEFHDPVLARLVREAIESNHDVRQSAARVAEYRALSRAQHAALLPTLDFGAGGARSRDVSAVTLQPYLSTGWQAEFQASYEVDLWGRLDALDKAAQLTSQSVAFQRDAVVLSVAAATASAYIGLCGLDAQLDVAQRTHESRARSLALVQERQEAGWGNALETSQAESEWRASAAALPQLALAIERQERMLTILLGRRPGPIERGHSLDELRVPALPDAGLPSQLVRRRPDIAVAERQVAAADAQWQAARAQLLPSVRLTSSFGRVGSSVLRDDPFSIWSVGGSLLAPLLNGGRLSAQADAASSRRDQAVVGYERVVLNAFSEVETQLGTLQRQQERAVALLEQQKAVERSLRQARRRHDEGYASYLDELLAQRNLYNVEQSRVQVQAELLQASVSLYQALGGGWREPEPR